MCGIAGIIGPNIDEAKMEAMVDSLRHRGPDSSGAYINADQNVCLGHTRLSIVDLTENGHQPMSFDGGNLVITFNGEIYNHKELRKELSEFRYKSNTDTDGVLAAYRQRGES